MAFKFIAFFATVAVVAQAASFWPGQQNDQRVWQDGRSQPSWPASRNWAWNENVDRQIDMQNRRNDQWQRVQNQDQWNDQWNRENGNWEAGNTNEWNNQERQQWQQQNWNRNNWDDDRYDNHPRYEFGYEVRDPWTGDFKSHQESRDGDVVRGQYSMMDADGSRRVVDYTADDERGFNANVRREGWSRH